MWPLSLPFRITSLTTHPTPPASSEIEDPTTHQLSTTEESLPEPNQNPTIQSDLVLYLDGRDECILRANKLQNHFEVCLHPDCVSTNDMEVAIDMFLSSVPSELLRQLQLRLKINTTSIMLPFMFRGVLVDTTTLSFDMLRAVCNSALTKYSYTTTKMSYSGSYFTHLYRTNVHSQTSTTDILRQHEEDDNDSELENCDMQSNPANASGALIEEDEGEEEDDDESENENDGTSSTHEELSVDRDDMKDAPAYDTSASPNKRKSTDDLVTEVKRERHDDGE
jgi:hypothetical protein